MNASLERFDRLGGVDLPTEHSINALYRCASYLDRNSNGHDIGSADHG
jgi:hypothetical protein